MHYWKFGVHHQKVDLGNGVSYQKVYCQVYQGPCIYSLHFPGFLLLLYYLCLLWVLYDIQYYDNQLMNFVLDSSSFLLCFLPAGLCINSSCSKTLAWILLFREYLIFLCPPSHLSWCGRWLYCHVLQWYYNPTIYYKIVHCSIIYSQSLFLSSFVCAKPP